MPRYPRNAPDSGSPAGYGERLGQHRTYPVGGRLLQSDINDAAIRMAADRRVGFVSGLRGPTVQTSPEEWWRETGVSGNLSGEASISSPNSGGSIWGEPTVESGGGRSPNLIEDPGLDWTGREETVGSPIVETPTDTSLPLPDAPLFPDITDRGVAPTGDTEWTTSPEERRFLPTGASGLDLRNFGLNTGNNLSLGEFFNTPLSAMNYGEGYPPVEAGRTLTTGEGTNWNSTRQQWEQYNPATGEFEATSDPTGSGGDPLSNTTFPEIREAIGIPDEETGGSPRSGGAPDTNSLGSPMSGGGFTPDPQRGLSIILNNTPSLNNPAAVRALQGGASTDQLIGRAQFDSHAANMLQMWATGLHGPPNVGQDAPSPSAGHGFNTFGRLNEEGHFEQTGRFPRNFRSRIGEFGPLIAGPGGTVGAYNAAAVAATGGGHG